MLRKRLTQILLQNSPFKRPLLPIPFITLFKTNIFCTFATINTNRNSQNIDIDIGIPIEPFNSKVSRDLESLRRNLKEADTAFSNLEYEKAATIYKEVLAFTMDHFQHEKEANAKLLIKVGQCYLYLNNPEESAYNLIEAFKIIVDLHGKEHMITAQVLALMGNLNFMCNRFENALKNFEESMHIYKKLENSPAEEEASVLRLYGNVQEKLKNSKEALEAYKEAIIKYSKDEDKSPLQLYDVGKDIAKLHLKSNEFEGAYNQYVECIRIAKKYLERDEMALADIEERCGEICLKLDRKVDAAGHFEQAANYYESKVGSGHMKVTELSIKAANLKQEGSGK